MWRWLERGNGPSVLLRQFISWEVTHYWHCKILISPIQLNLSSRAILGTEETERLHQESMYGLSAKKSGR